MRRNLLLVLVLGTAACGDGATGPASLTSAYALQNTPVVLEHEAGGQVVITADTLYLAGESATRRVTYRFDWPEGVTDVSATEQYRVRLALGRLELDMVCPPNALSLCTPPPHLWGLPRDFGLVLRSQFDPGVSLVYVKLQNNLRF